MLSAVGTAVAVNPDSELRDIAKARGWQIRDFRTGRKAARIGVPSVLGAGALATLRTFINCTGLGMAAAVTGDNQVQLGNSHAVPHAFQALQVRSDARDKADIRDTRLGLDFIRALRPVDFRWNLRDDYSSVSEGAAAGSDDRYGIVGNAPRRGAPQSNATQAATEGAPLRLSLI